MNETKKQKLVFNDITKEVIVMGYKKILQLQKIVNRKVIESKQHRLTFKKINYEKSKKNK